MSIKDWVRYRDASGDQHVTYDANITNEQSAKDYVASRGGSETDYIGEVGVQQNGFVNYGDKSGAFQLNANGSVTELKEGKATTTQVDGANSEPLDARQASDKINSGVGVVGGTVETMAESLIGKEEVVKTATDGTIDFVDEI